MRLNGEPPREIVFRRSRARELSELARQHGNVAIFSGPSGPGKPLAAEVIAADLGRPLHRVDLDAIASKYIGETEKHIDRLFADAAAAGAVLFFDEADAVFGKRSGVRDSHERYANLDVSFLIQRIDAYEGLVIISSNRRENLGDAVASRIRLVVEFPKGRLEKAFGYQARATGV
jgi:SpoVK/Ycf46/Vps4 family AAA+-type ATPase